MHIHPKTSACAVQVTNAWCTMEARRIWKREVDQGGTALRRCRIQALPQEYVIVSLVCDC
jgi:hypothetical protein